MGGQAVELTDRSDACFLLDIDKATMRGRLSGRPGGNDLGRTGATLEVALASPTAVIARPADAWGGYTVDATQPVSRGVEDLHPRCGRGR